jgi:hypothetical protein
MKPSCVDGTELIVFAFVLFALLRGWSSTFLLLMYDEAGPRFLLIPLEASKDRVL